MMKAFVFFPPLPLRETFSLAMDVKCESQLHQN